MQYWVNLYYLGICKASVLGACSKNALHVCVSAPYHADVCSLVLTCPALHARLLVGVDVCQWDSGYEIMCSQHKV